MEMKFRMTGIAIGVACIWSLGCSDPIYQFRGSLAPSSNGSEDMQVSSSRYDWPLSGGQYFIAKPPPIAFVAKPGKPLKMEDPAAAKLIAWNEDEFAPNCQFNFTRRL